MNQRSRLRRKQFGFTIVEMTIAATLLAATLAGGLWAARQSALKSMFEAQGDTLKAIGNAGGNEYILRNYGELQKATPSVPGVLDPYRPTMTELKALGLPIQQFANTGYQGLGYKFEISRTPVGCTPPSCDVTGLVYLAGQITDPSTGKVSALGLGQIISAIGGDGGFSDDMSPNTISGSGGQWSKANPMGNLLGVVSMQLGYGTLGYQQFLRRDGTLPMLGTLNMQDGGGTRHDIASVNKIDAQKAALPSGNSLQIGNGYFYGDTLNVAARSQPGGGFYVQDVNGNVADIKAVNNISASGTVSGNVIRGDESYTNGWFRVNGGGGLYFQAYGGGWYMADPTWVRAYNGTSIWTPNVVQADGQVRSASVYSWGRSIADEYVQVNGWASEGAGCTPDGLIARGGSGMLSCTGGIWKGMGTVPSGTTCGMSQDGRYDWTGPQLCQGYNPWSGCPAGYHQGVVASIKGETAMSCYKD